jgi:hypothetical protein
MTSEVLTERLAAMSVSQRVNALSMIYSRLTACSRELFMPDRTNGKEQLVIAMPHGITELHHTLANLSTSSLGPVPFLLFGIGAVALFILYRRRRIKSAPDLS